jgi:hypothetical protein
VMMNRRMLISVALLMRRKKKATQLTQPKAAVDIDPNNQMTAILSHSIRSLQLMMIVTIVGWPSNSAAEKTMMVNRSSTRLRCH